MIHLVNCRISARRSIQILADTREIVTDTLRVMRVAIEGPNNDFDDILTSALDLWKDDPKFCKLYSNPECYLFGASDAALEEVT
jgi:hypothetical protein